MMMFPIIALHARSDQICIHISSSIFCRRDSFITHRAFCDALAQETARITAAAATHPPNLHHHFHFSAAATPPIFNPIHDLTPIIPPFPTTFSNLPPPSITYYTPNWDHFIKESTAPSLFSSNHQIHHDAAARMSATALLQKAALMGATTAAAELGGFGVKCVSGGDGGERICGLYSTSSAASGLGSDVESSVNENNSGGGEMYRKRRRMEEEMSETRDFLGVGITGICHASSFNGWI